MSNNKSCPLVIWVEREEMEFLNEFECLVVRGKE
jgi:hypothetical protein